MAFKFAQKRKILDFGCVLVIFGRFYSEIVPVQVHIKIMTLSKCMRNAPTG